MKTNLLLALIATCFCLAPRVFAQGSLTPPGAPGPTMLTLSQMEPRTPISGPFDIIQPGSYYLTTNITINSGNAIQIEANNVRLDLSGFTLSSTASSAAGYAIYIGPSSLQTNVTIVNGFISSGVTNNSSGVFDGNGFAFGVYGNGYNILVKDVSVYGCLDDGIYLINNSSVVACNVNTAGIYGIYAECTSDSTAVNCGEDGLAGKTANNCYGQANGNGIDVLTANNCYGQSTGSEYGVDAASADNCYGISSTGTGLSATTANNCFGESSSGAGIFAYNANNCFGINTGSGYGVDVNVVATGCLGESSTGTGLSAFIASVCHGESSTGAATNITHNVNSF